MDVNQQQWTMMRAAYGDTPAAMMASGGGGQMDYGGGPGFATDPLAAIGQQIRPVAYIPPARAVTGYYGMTQMPSGLFQSSLQAAGLTVPRSMFAYDVQQRGAADVGERLGGGLVGAGLMAGGSVAGLAAGSLLGGGIMAGLGAFAVTGMAASAVQTAVAQRREITGFLETAGYRFVGPGSSMVDPRTGTGLSIRSRTEAAEFMRTTELKDPFLDMADMTNILKQGVANNMFVGTQNMEDFKKKFKDVTDAVKLVTKTLNVTLEEGMKTLKDLRTAGMTDPNTVKSVISMADWTGRMAGKTGAEMVGIGLQGAEMFRGTGISMQVGMQATMMNMASTRALRDAKLISDEAVAQAGGEEQLALQQNARGLAFAQSAMGRGLNAAFFRPGMAGGGFNTQSFMNTIMSGGGSIPGLAGMAASNLSSPSALISYQANQHKFQSEMAKTFGGQGLQIAQYGALTAEAAFLSGTTGAKREDSFRYLALQQGMSEPEIEKALASMKGAGSVFRSALEGARQTQNRMIAENSRQNSAVWRMYSKAEQFTGEAVDLLAKPLNAVIDDVKENTMAWYQKTFQGTETVDLGKTYTRVNVERTEDRKAAAKITGGVDIRGLGGERLKEVLEDRNFRAFAKSAGVEVDATMTAEEAKKAGRVIIGGGTITENGRVLVTSIAREGADKLQKALDNRVTMDQAKVMEERGDFKNLRTASGEAVKDIWTIMSERGTGELKLETMDQAAQAFFGKTSDKLSRVERAYIRSQVKDTSLGKSLEDMDKKSSAGKDVLDSLKVADLKNLKESREKTMAAVKEVADDSKVKGTLTEEIVGLLSDAAIQKDPAKKKKLEADLMKKYSEANVGKTTTEIQSDVRKLEVSIKPELTDRFRAESIAINQRQQEISTGVLTGAARLQLADMKGVTSAQAQEAVAVLDDIQRDTSNVEDFIKKVRSKTTSKDPAVQKAVALAKKTVTGDNTFAVAEVLDQVRKESDPDKIRSLLQDTSKVGFLDDAKRKEMILGVSEGRLTGSQVSQNLLEEFKMVGAGKVYQQGSTAGAQGINTPEGAAGKSIEQTVLIQQQTYEAMSALAKRLKLGV